MEEDAENEQPAVLPSDQRGLRKQASGLIARARRQLTPGIADQFINPDRNNVMEFNPNPQ
jgi:hypothetical protein